MATPVFANWHVVLKGLIGSIGVATIPGLNGSMTIVDQVGATGSSPTANSGMNPDTCAEDQMKTSFHAAVGMLIPSPRPPCSPALVLLPNLLVESFPMKSSLALIVPALRVVGEGPMGGTPPAACNLFLPPPRDPFLASTMAATMCWMDIGAVGLARAQFEGGSLRLGTAANLERARTSRPRRSLLRPRQFEGPTAGLGRSEALRNPGRPGRRRASMPAIATSASPSPTTRSEWQQNASAMLAHHRRRISQPRHSAWRP